MNGATFNQGNHCLTSGWATYQAKPLHHFRVRCYFGRHLTPKKPAIPNGYSGPCYGHCERCGAYLKWFVLGQHRYGGPTVEAPR